MQEQEIWKDIRGLEGRYQVSSIGRIKRLEHTVPYIDGRNKRLCEMIMTNNVDRDGYEWIGFYIDKKQYGFRLHRLVADAFIEEVPSDMQINHINGIRNDNRVENLEICTCSQNVLHAFRVLGKIAHQTCPVTAYYIKERKSRFVKPIKGDEFMSFPSIKDAAIALGINRSCIGESIKKKTQTAGGYLWEKY